MPIRIFILSIALLLVGCESGVQSRFPMEKRFWTPDDYNDVVREMRFNTPEGQRLPEFSNPETSPIFEKIVDHQNFLVVLTDDELGLKHKNGVARSFFEEYRGLVDEYSLIDRQDKFLYGRELVAIMKFGLDLQQYYFKLGNDNIIQEADDVNASGTRSILNTNVKTVFENYNHYLDFVNKENAFDETALKEYSEGIDLFFPKLFETFPGGDRRITKRKAELMLKKAENPDVRRSLESLLSRIEEELSATTS